VRILVGILVFVVGVVIVTRLAGVENSLVGLAIVSAAVLFVVVPVVNRVLLGRKYGWGDGCCVSCRGFGKAFYGTGGRTFRARCKECNGSGSGAGGPGRRDDRSRRRLRQVS
jgi:hypothetical protein